MLNCPLTNAGMKSFWNFTQNSHSASYYVKDYSINVRLGSWAHSARWVSTWRSMLSPLDRVGLFYILRAPLSPWCLKSPSLKMHFCEASHRRYSTYFPQVFKQKRRSPTRWKETSLLWISTFWIEGICMQFGLHACRWLFASKMHWLDMYTPHYNI